MTDGKVIMITRRAPLEYLKQKHFWSIEVGG